MTFAETPPERPRSQRPSPFSCRPGRAWTRILALGRNDNRPTFVTGATASLRHGSVLLKGFRVLAIEFRIPVNEIASVLPTKSADSRQDWGNLTSRANDLPLPPKMQRAPDDGQVLTHEEAENVARIVAQGGNRLYPGEQALVPFMQAITRPVDASRIRDLGPGTAPVIPLPARHQPESVPTASITESDLNPFAKRLAETRPGNKDGNTADLRFTDMSDDPSSMTFAEFDYCGRIRAKYFPVTYAPKSAAEPFTVPFYRSPDGRVTATLQREVSMQFFAGSAPSVQDTVASKALEVTVPRGAKLVTNYDGVSSVKSTPALSTEAGDVYKLDPGNGRIVCIKVVAQVEGNEPGVPQVLAVFGARMPKTSTTRRFIDAKS